MTSRSEISQTYCLSKFPKQHYDIGVQKKNPDYALKMLTLGCDVR